jgi:hypothetical protein
MKVAQHFSAGSGFSRPIRPVRDDRNGCIWSLMPHRGRLRARVDRPSREASVLKHQPGTEVLGYCPLSSVIRHA